MSKLAGIQDRIHSGWRSLGPRVRAGFAAEWPAFLTALQFLTIVPPLLRRAPTERELGQAVGYFPLVGACLGLLLWLNAVLLYWIFPEGIAAAGLLGVWILATGALHVDGFLDTCDALFGGRTVEERLHILRDEHVGAYAVTGGLLLMLLKYAAILELSSAYAGTALIVVATLGRWMISWTMVHNPYRRAEGLGRTMKDHCGFRQRWLATGTAFLVALLVGGALGMVAVAAVILAGWLVARVAIERLDGFTGDVYGAVCEICEVAALTAWTAYEAWMI